MKIIGRISHAIIELEWKPGKILPFPFDDRFSASNITANIRPRDSLLSCRSTITRHSTYFKKD